MSRSPAELDDGTAWDHFDGMFLSVLGCIGIFVLAIIAIALFD
jgi:hypothetical protein